MSLALSLACMAMYALQVLVPQFAHDRHDTASAYIDKHNLCLKELNSLKAFAGVTVCTSIIQTHVLMTNSKSLRFCIQSHLKATVEEKCVREAILHLAAD